MEEILTAGINAYTALNIQHIWSLKERFGAATRGLVKETIPYKIVEQASDAVFIDISVKDLLKRLREGKVFVTSTGQVQAAQNFFKESNLIALRDLAKAYLAEQVEKIFSS